MAPIIEADNASNTVWRFVQKHKIALTAAGVVAAGAAGYIVYSARQLAGVESGTGAEKPLSALAKKNKKRRSKKKQSNSEKEGGKSAEGASYPTNAEGLPAVDEEYVKSLSEDKKERVSLVLKEEGNVAFKKKDFPVAIAYYTAALTVKPDPVFYSNRSACYASEEKFDKVVEDTTAALKIKPDYSKCLLRRATANEKLGRYTDAMFDLTCLTICGGFDSKNIEPVLERNLRQHSENLFKEQLKSNVPSLPSASSIASFLGAFKSETDVPGLDKEHVEKGSGDEFLLQALEKVNESNAESYDLADSYFNQAIAAYGDISKDHADANKLALALEYSGAFKFLKNISAEALLDLDKAEALNARPRVYILKALISADKGSFEEAISFFDKAIAQDPKNYDAYYHKGQMFYLINDLAKAEEHFSTAKELNPDNVYAYIQLACIAYRKGDADLAEKKFAEAKKRFPTSAEIPNYHGEILADSGKLDEAIDQFDISYRLQQASGFITIGVVPLVNKASILSRQGEDKFKEAGLVLQKACDEDPKSELARVTLAQIKLQQDNVNEAIKLFEESSKLARTGEEKIQAISFAEAAKMQARIKQEPYWSSKLNEMMAAYGVATA